MRPAEGRLSGWLVVDKPAGLTSAAVVTRVKRLAAGAKVGHGGTLDPMATGVLPIALGEATKTVAYTMAGRKRYRFAVRWGESRDTDDAEGGVTGTSPTRPRAEEIDAALDAFRGEISQVPPRYSAVKIRGKRAYALARGGDAVDLAPRVVSIYRLERIASDAESATFDVECGKGTYVRALARDLAGALGTLGYVSSLRRCAAGAFGENDAISLDCVEALGHSSALAEQLLPVEAALVDIPALDLTETEAKRLRHGQAIAATGGDEGVVCAMLDRRVVALAECEAGMLRPVRVFNI